MRQDSLLKLKNPHSVIAALRSRPKDVVELTYPKGSAGSEGSIWGEAIDLARAAKINVHGVNREEPRGGDSKQGRASGYEATVRPRSPVDLSELWSKGSKDSGIWLALDQIQDPQNLGAIFRSASFFGVQGILLTLERSAGLTGTAYDVASGAVEDVPFAVETNLRRALDLAKESDIWVLGTSEHATESAYKVDWNRRWLIALGNEESGIRRLTEEVSDQVVSLPRSKSARANGVTSLNVGSAAAALLSLAFNRVR